MFFDQSTLYLGLALLILIVSNILLGSINSIFQQQFDVKKLYIGMGKGSLIIVVLCGILIAGKLTPDIVAVNIGGKEVNLLNATYLLMLSSYIWYAKEVLIKLSDFVSGKYIVGDEINKTATTDNNINSELTQNQKL